MMQPVTLPAKTLTVRLPSELYSAAKEVARRRDLSLNALLQESLIATIRDAAEEARYEDYSLLGKDTQLCDVDYAIHAQAEVMLGDAPS